ncbi:MAG: tripartite tricarboxylate transporter TctB family protein [SAR324 cluster bacterium]|nr:tripartite tricarboxylate transporter TctB family protein [SAR324 cluster bacterium]
MQQKNFKKIFSSDVIFALFFITFSIVLLLIIPYQVEKPLSFMGGAGAALDPDLFPRVVGFFLLGTSIWYLVRSLFQTGTKLELDLDIKGGFNILVTLVIFLAYALLMDPIGFIESSAVTLAILMSFMGNRNFLITGGVSLGIPFGIYYLFTRQLLVSLPESYLSSVLDKVLALAY